LEALVLFLVAVLVPAEASASERLRVAVGLETRLQLCLAAVLCRTKVSEAVVRAAGSEALVLFLVAVSVPTEASERLRVAVGLETRLQLCLAAVLCRTKVSEAVV
jgi:hypothetical protein